MANPLEEYVLRYPRIYGAILTIVGMGIMYWAVILPLQAAESSAAEIWISSTWVIIGESFLLFGLPSLALGTRFIRMFPLNREQPKTPAFYIAVAILVVVGIVSYDALKTTLIAKGYIFR